MEIPAAQAQGGRVVSGSDLARKNNWRNIFFFVFVTAGALVGAPLYLRSQGFRSADWILFAVYLAGTGMSITVGYHRLYSHRAFSAHRLVHLFTLFFGAAAFEQSALDWASQHRDHHRFVDTERDPYNIKKGFFYAHMGWLLFWTRHIHHDNVQDMTADPLIRNQHERYYLWCILSGILVPVAIGYLAGSLWGALWIAVCLRVFLVHHATFSINSVCHRFGRATYDPHATARDHWLVAFLTNGEGYHNFHHRFPSDYRNGVRWYHWDPSKWFIALCSFLGLATGLKRTSEKTILEARLAARA